MIEHVLDQQGLTRKDLEPYIGPHQRVWEIMERRCRLTAYVIIQPDGTIETKADTLASLQRGDRHWDLAESDELIVHLHSDLVLDGCLAVDQLSTRIADAVKQHLRNDNPI